MIPVMSTHISRASATLGPCEPTLAILQAIVAGHTSTIPFENLDVVAKRPIRLDLPALHEKLVHHTRGGYCYEHNLLLLDVLQRLGFQAKGLAARVHRSRPPGMLPPRSHMLLWRRSRRGTPYRRCRVRHGADRPFGLGCRARAADAARRLPACARPTGNLTCRSGKPRAGPTFTASRSSRKCRSITRL